MLAARLQTDTAFRASALRNLVEQGTISEEQARGLSAQFAMTGEQTPARNANLPDEDASSISGQEDEAARPVNRPGSQVGRTAPTARSVAASAAPAEKSFDDSVLNPHTVSQSNPYPNLPSTKALYEQFPEGAKGLTRFGAEIFRPDVVGLSQFPMDLPAGPEYVLGPGDNLTLDIWGGYSQKLTRTVDREGRISLPEAGPVVVAGLTLVQAQKLIQAKLEPQYRNANVDLAVTLGRSRERPKQCLQDS